MKRIIVITLVLLISVAFVGCSKQVSETSNSSKETTTSQTTEKATNKKVAKDIDAIAKELGYVDGSETYYSMIGAKAGKEYNNGKFELYLFDENSQAYKDIIGGKGTLTAVAHKDGVVLILPSGNEKDDKLIKQFNNIEFE